jgi:hypothetical protein
MIIVYTLATISAVILLIAFASLVHAVKHSVEGYEGPSGFVEDEKPLANSRQESD